MIAWQDKYERLHESHKRVQKINQSLEDKLLKLVDRNATERAQLTSDVATLSVRLAQANYNIGTLQREIVSVTPEVSLRKMRSLIADFFSLFLFRRDTKLTWVWPYNCYSANRRALCRRKLHR